jgi:hypothetical protein
MVSLFRGSDNSQPYGGLLRILDVDCELRDVLLLLTVSSFCNCWGLASEPNLLLWTDS